MISRSNFLRWMFRLPSGRPWPIVPRKYNVPVNCCSSMTGISFISTLVAGAAQEAQPTCKSPAEVTTTDTLRACILAVPSGRMFSSMSPTSSGAVSQISSAVSWSATTSSGAISQISSAISWSAITWHFHIPISSAVSWSATMWHFHILCLLATAAATRTLVYIAGGYAKRPFGRSRIIPCGDDPDGYHDLPAESGAGGSYYMNLLLQKVFGRLRLATGFSLEGVFQCGRWLVSVINDSCRWQLHIYNS